MSKQIHDGEEDRKKQVKVRANAELVDRFDEFVNQSEQYSSRSAAVRDAMKGLIGDDGNETPRQPPQDDDTLAEAYYTLVEIANCDGIVTHELAINELNTQLGKSTAVVESAVLGKLWDRGYIRSITNFNTSNRSWKLSGWSE